MSRTDPANASWRDRARRPKYFLPAILIAVALIVVVTVVLQGLGGHTVINGEPRKSSSPPSSSSPPTSPSSSTSSSPAASVCAPAAAVAGTPTAAQANLLGDRVGFGAGVTGGAGAQIVHVTTDADSGPGSLRTAASSDAPAWIVFDKDMTIKLVTPLAVCSNKTIDGQGRKVEITGHGVEGLDLINVSNVMLESLTLHDFGDVTKTKNNNTPDAIHLDHAKGVWIDHCDLSMAGDKLIGVTNGSSALTVSWTHFHNQEQTFQIGNQTTGSVDVAQTATIEHNFFDHTGYRNPVASYGRVHVYNNYYLGWRLYGVRSERVGQMFVQNNVFAAGANTRASLVTPHGKGCNDTGTRCDDRPGYLKAVGNLLLNHAVLKDSEPQNVFDPAKSYRFTAEPATPALAARIQAGVGPRP